MKSREVEHLSHGVSKKTGFEVKSFICTYHCLIIICSYTPSDGSVSLLHNMMDS